MPTEILRPAGETIMRWCRVVRGGTRKRYSRRLAALLSPCLFQRDSGGFDPAGADPQAARWLRAGHDGAADAPGQIRRAGRLAVDGAALARFARELAESADHGEGRVVVAHSARNTFSGLISRVVRDTVMAQVEIQAGPHRFMSLLSREAADELVLEPGMLAVAGSPAD